MRNKLCKKFSMRRNQHKGKKDSNTFVGEKYLGHVTNLYLIASTYRFLIYIDPDFEF